MAFKLSTVLRGHELDVRAVCPAVFPPGAILTASRDRTTRVWVPDGFAYNERHVLTGHENFISAVCAVPPSDKHPHGLIATGGHDNNILVWTLESLEPLYRLTGHTGAVCSLVSGKFGTLISGSWDNTAKVWITSKCVMTLKGHEAAVWSVQLMPDHGLMLTGSADKNIKMWRAGSCERTFSGHTDCVRGLIVISLLEFLSCSNDCTIRRWMTTGECLQEYTGHSSFIYNLAVFPNCQDKFASVGEDRTLRIWEGGNCKQTITLPAQSVWCVTCLENGDVVTGSSDGVTRVFTCCPERYASVEEIKGFEEEVASHAIPAQTSGQIGDIKMDQLPGPEALLRPGKRSGQTIMVRRGKTVECHQWNEMEEKWEKVGEVVGAPGTETSSNSNKTLYNGKEFDIVFNVEIQEGKPPLKLPFNYGDDPWVAAHNFLAKNDLSQMFLDQVVDFILKNTKDVTIGQGLPPQVSDPFTGGSRYVPGSSSMAGSDNKPTVGGGGGVDPFTGSGSYRPAYTANNQSGIGTGGGADPFTGNTSYRPAETTTQKTNKYFPKTEYVSFESANTKAIIGKVKELNSSLNEGLQFDDDELQHLSDLLCQVSDNSKNKTPSDKQLQALTKGLSWPDNTVFPILDIIRLAVQCHSVAAYFCVSEENTMERLLDLVRPDSPVPNVLLVFRIFSNLFLWSEGCLSLIKYREKVLFQAKSWILCPNKNARISLCTVILNYSILLLKEPDLDTKTLCIATIVTILQTETDNEVRFRCLVALGNLICSDENSLSYAKTLEVDSFLKSLVSIKDPLKVGECATFVLSVLSA